MLWYLTVECTISSVWLYYDVGTFKCIVVTTTDATVTAISAIIFGVTAICITSAILYFTIIFLLYFEVSFACVTVVVIIVFAIFGVSIYWCCLYHCCCQPCQHSSRQNY